MTNVVIIEGIGKVYGEKLIAAGIKTTEKLLEAACKAKARDELAAKPGIPAKSKFLCVKPKMAVTAINFLTLI
jgi:hypothetical protein